MQLALLFFALWLRVGQALAPPATTVKKTRRRLAAPTLGDVEPMTVLAADAVILTAR